MTSLSARDSVIRDRVSWHAWPPSLAERRPPSVSAGPAHDAHIRAAILHQRVAMTPKPTHADDPKRRRKVLTLLEKIAILDKLRTGVSIASLSRQIDINESTIRTIRKSEQKIRQSVRISSRSSANIAKICRRDPVLEKMEALLVNWIDEQKNLDAPLDPKTVRDKAKIIYYVVAEQLGVPSKINGFQASKGWYENFKKRSNPLNAPLSVKDEPKDETMEPQFYSVDMDESDWTDKNEYVSKAKSKGDRNAIDNDLEDNESSSSGSKGESSTPPPVEIDDDDGEIDAKSISACMRKLGFLKNLILEMDPDTDRSCKANRKLDSAMLPYIKILGQIKRGKNKRKH